MTFNYKYRITYGNGKTYDHEDILMCVEITEEEYKRILHSAFELFRKGERCIRERGADRLSRTGTWLYGNQPGRSEKGGSGILQEKCGVRAMDGMERIGGIDSKDSIENWITCCHTRKVLKRAGIETMEQLKRLSEDQIRQIRGIGPVITGDLQRIMMEWVNRKC